MKEPAATRPSAADRRASSVTLEQVALAAGVSRATVSRVVNGLSSVDGDIASRVRISIKELGYVPNLSARSLASRQAGSIALVVPEDVAYFFGDPFFGTMVAGLNARLGESNLLLNLVISAPDPDQTVQHLLGGTADAVVVLSHELADPLVERIATTVPVVIAGRPTSQPADWCHHVDFDNVDASRRATAHLLSLTDRQVGTIAGPQDTPTGVDRLQGFFDAHTDAAREPGPVLSGDFTQASAVDAVAHHFPRLAELGGLFVANDLMALGALAALTQRGIRIPQDMALMGFDDLPAAALASPGLSTVHQDSRRQGEVVGDVVLELLAGESPPIRTVLPTRLVLRGTTAPAAPRRG